jgi:starch synthase
MVPLFVKKTYKDNPLFANTRIIYSVYNDQFEQPLNNEMARKIAEDGIDLNDISVITEPTFENYTKLALAYSDAAIKGSEVINPNIEKHIKDSGIQYLDYQPKDSYIDSYFDFYNKIL